MSINHGSKNFAFGDDKYLESRKCSCQASTHSMATFCHVQIGGERSAEGVCRNSKLLRSIKCESLLRLYQKSTLCCRIRRFEDVTRRNFHRMFELFNACPLSPQQWTFAATFECPLSANGGHSGISAQTERPPRGGLPEIRSGVLIREQMPSFPANSAGSSPPLFFLI